MDLQSLLAVIFVMTGAMKLLTPAAVMEAQSPLPLALVRFVGLCEVAGALGMILPGLLRMRPTLTPLSAAGLVALMIFATILTPVMISPDPVLMLNPGDGGRSGSICRLRTAAPGPLRAHSKLD